MNHRNSTNIVWIDTHRVTVAEMEDDISYHAETLSQGLDATNRVPPFSIYAGQPEFTEADNRLRATVWRIYSVVIFALVAAAVISVVKQ